MALKEIVQQTVTGLAYDLVAIERCAAGLLRITIDFPWRAAQADALAVERFVTVEDCEKVTRQLQFALEVEAIEYRRLEVSSPGLDRPLRHVQDFVRFAGQTVDLILKDPVGAAAQGQVSGKRKKFRGVLEPVVGTAPAPDAAPARWQIVWSDEPVVKPGQRVSKNRAPAPVHTLEFELSELKEIHLAPIVSFKGRARPDQIAPVVNQN